MRFKLFEGYNEDVAAEKKRHKDTIDAIKKKYHDGVRYCLTNLIEDYGFELVAQLPSKNLNYSINSEDGDDSIEFTNDFLKELIRANKKIKSEFGLDIYLYLTDITDHSKFLHEKWHKINSGMPKIRKDRNELTCILLSDLIRCDILNDFIGHEVDDISIVIA